MFSQTVEYALRAMVFLAGEPYHHGLAQNSENIAKATKVPHAYLSKVLKQLAEAELISSQRGVHGGFSLLVPPGELRILDIINAVEPIQRISYCPLGLPSHGRHLCRLHQQMDEALGRVEEALSDSTLADVLADPNPCIPLVDSPSSKKPRKR